MLAALTLLIAAQGGAVQQPLQVEGAGGGFRITAADPIPVADLPSLEVRLNALATATCGNQTLRWGRFTHQNLTNPDGSISVGNYVQNFKCIDPATDPYRPVSADWEPGEAELAVARETGEKYVQAMIDGDVEGGLALLDPEMGVARDEWLEFVRPVSNPGPGYVSIVGEGWEANPANFPYPGGYISQYFQGEFEQYAKFCISLILYRLDERKYEVSQMNITSVPKASVEDGKYNAAQLASICA